MTDPEPLSGLVQCAGPMRPGDTLVVGLVPQLTMLEVERVRARFEQVLPDIKVVVLDQVANLLVYRPDGEVS
jgi:hypothetical protein